MSDCYVGQIMLTGFDFAQKYFAQCNGQILPISQNNALFALLGTSYGGNGNTNFALPDMRGRVPVGSGASLDSAWQPSPYTNGLAAGAAAVTLIANELPSHNHSFNGVNANGTVRSPLNHVFGGSPNEALYAAPGALAGLNASTLGTTGGGNPHDNIQPYLTINFVIALYGIYPSRS